MPFAASTASLARVNATKNASPSVFTSTPPCREKTSRNAVVLGEHIRVPLAELIQKARRALDVREEQSDRAARKLPHAHMIALGRGISKDPAGSLRVEPWSTSTQRATERGASASQASARDLPS